MVKVIRANKWRAGYFVPALLVVVYMAWALVRPLPQLKPTTSLATIQIPVPASTLSWPVVGQSAVGVVGAPLINSHGAQTPAPTASTAKIITVLTVLRSKPLSSGQQGPLITLTAQDVAIYNSYVARGGSVVPVQAGERISEYQMLQAILLPSANNMADSLAIWAYGSLRAYANAASQYIHELGLNATHIGPDASGFDPTTTSSAHDLVRLGEMVMQKPVLAQIVGQSSASGIPLTNGVKNVNFLLGSDNIIGVKTGNTDQAGGVYVAAARTTAGGKPVTIVTALVGAPTLFEALKDSLPLIKTAQTNFTAVPIAAAGSPVGSYRLPWGGTVEAREAGAASVQAWKGSHLAAIVQLKPVPPKAAAGTSVGTLTVTESPFSASRTVPLVLQSAPPQPSLTWRLLHP